MRKAGNPKQDWQDFFRIYRTSQAISFADKPFLFILKNIFDNPVSVFRIGRSSGFDMLDAVRSRFLFVRFAIKRGVAFSADVRFLVDDRQESALEEISSAAFDVVRSAFRASQRR